MPPANFVGAQRVESWARHLFENGVYPIIITRQWNDQQTNVTDKIENNVREHQKFETHEVYRLPYKYSLRDQLYTNKKKPFLRKALTFWETFWANYFLSALPYYNIYAEANQVLEKDQDIKMVIASGRPFQVFSIGSKLKKDFPNIKWVPDYRDEWTIHPEYVKNHFFSKMIYKLDKRSERKWTSNADFFLSVSDSVVANITNFIGKKGYTILNGFDHEEVMSQNEALKKNGLNLTYSGSVYSFQDFTPIIDTLRILNEGKGMNFTLTFIGVDLNSNPGQKLKQIADDNSFIRILPRINREDYLGEIKQADVLFLTAYDQNKGWYPVKLFEYYNTTKPVILFPSDNDVMERFILDTSCGYALNSKDDCQAILTRLHSKKHNGESIDLERNSMVGQRFSRKHQAKMLAEIIHSETTNFNA